MRHLIDESGLALEFIIVSGGIKAGSETPPEIHSRLLVESKDYLLKGIFSNVIIMLDY